jgi:hypothetical protein
VRKLRLGILLALLAGVSLWAAMAHHRRAARSHWHRQLTVAVTLVGGDAEKWRRGLGELERWFSSEMARYREVIDDPPLRFVLYGPVNAAVPQLLPEDEGLWTRARHAWRLSREVAKLDAAAEVGPADVRLYVFTEPFDTKPTVEGAGEVGGDAGFVRVTLDEDLSPALAATAHELFHTLGATDRYDAAGHAVAEDGLDDAERGRLAEVMVGEISPGKLPRSLDELRVGTITAQQVGWLLTPTGR